MRRTKDTRDVIPHPPQVIVTRTVSVKRQYRCPGHGSLDCDGQHILRKEKVPQYRSAE